MPNADRVRVLFLCTGNSCRSQMAEGWTHHLHGDRFDAHSAGIEARGLDPRAVRVMGESGVDISGQVSQTLDQVGTDFDVVVTVCGHADRHCPRFPGPTRVVHRGFDDPPGLARDAPGEAAALDVYRRVRDEIRTFVEELPSRLSDPGVP